MTAYEVLQVIKERKRTSKPYSDGRDVEHLGNFSRVDRARSMLIESLLGHSPSGTSEDGKDQIGEQILSFSIRIQKIIPSISPNQIRSLIAIRPSNSFELASIFSTPDEWSIVAMNVDEIIQEIEIFFPHVEYSE